MLRALFIVLYEEPLSYNTDKESTAMGIGGDKMSKRCCLQMLAISGDRSGTGRLYLLAMMK